MDKFRRQVTPRAAVVVDDSLCIVLRTEGAGPHTITNVDAFKAALDDARVYVVTVEDAGRND